MKGKIISLPIMEKVKASAVLAPTLPPPPPLQVAHRALAAAESLPNSPERQERTTVLAPLYALALRIALGLPLATQALSPQPANGAGATGGSGGGGGAGGGLLPLTKRLAWSDGGGGGVGAAARRLEAIHVLTCMANGQFTPFKRPKVGKKKKTKKAKGKEAGGGEGEAEGGVEGGVAAAAAVQCSPMDLVKGRAQFR